MKSDVRSRGAKLLLIVAVALILVPVAAFASWCTWGTTTNGWVERVEPGGFYVTCNGMPVCQVTSSQQTKCTAIGTIPVFCTRDDGGGSHTINACVYDTADGCDTQVPSC